MADIPERAGYPSVNARQPAQSTRHSALFSPAVRQRKRFTESIRHPCSCERTVPMWNRYPGSAAVEYAVRHLSRKRVHTQRVRRPHHSIVGLEGRPIRRQGALRYSEQRRQRPALAVISLLLNERERRQNALICNQDSLHQCRMDPSKCLDFVRLIMRTTPGSGADSGISP
jgi:hypothetical protein